MRALEAAQAVGGDLRGKQSAAMLIVGAERNQEPWKGIVLELRVEDHPDPLKELRRLLQLQRAYEHMNRGDELLGKNQTEEALEEYCVAALIAPEIPELPFWHAVTLADLDRLEEALPLFREVFSRDPNLAILLQRLPRAGLFRVEPELLNRILSEAPSRPSDGGTAPASVQP
jgi:tetratricopeptide (TPR) repeat protein